MSPAAGQAGQEQTMDHQARLGQLQQALADHGLAGAVLTHSRDVYYYTGLALPAWLFVRPGDWRLFLRRGLDTLPEVCRLAPEGISACHDPAQACALLFPGPGQGEKVGLALDLLSVLEGRRWQKALGSRQLADVTPLVLGMRQIKDAAEIACLARACAALTAGHRAALAHLRPGISELEWAAAIEQAQRLAGHQGVYFLRQPDVLMGRGPAAFGPNLIANTGTVFTVTGVGLHASLPAGPSARRLAPGDLAVADIPTCLEGYHADVSRTYALGRPPEGAVELCQALKEISDGLIAGLHPGMACAEACGLAQDLAAGLGLGQSFQRLPAGAAIHYIGHGLGLELNEPPLLTPKNPARLEAGMTLALELHLLHPEGYLLKLEDTVHLAAGGGRLLSGEGRGLNLVE